MTFLQSVRKAFPQPIRTAILRNRFTSAALRLFIRRHQCRPHPQCGLTLCFDGQKHIGWSLGGLQSWEADYFRFCGDLFRRQPPKIVWDVGANVGAWTLWFADKSLSVNRIIAFEPDPENLKYLERNVSQNHLESHVSIRPVALSSSSGQSVFMSDPFTGTTGSLEQHGGFLDTYLDRSPLPIEVSTSTIDLEVASGMPEPDFLKVDVEGHEYDMLVGSRCLLEKTRPLILIEFGGSKSQAAFEFIQSHDYTFFCPVSRRQTDRATYELAAIPCERVSIYASSLDT